MFKKKLLHLLMSALCILSTVFCIQYTPMSMVQAEDVEEGEIYTLEEPVEDSIEIEDEVTADSATEVEHPARVIDEADLLDEYEEEELLSLVNEISERQQFDVVILTVDSLDGEDIQYFSADYYDYNGYGMGENYDGAMFTVSMAEREWYMLTTGAAIDILTDDILYDMEEAIIPYLSDGDYAEAFAKFAKICDAEVTYALEGNAEDDSTSADGNASEEVFEDLYGDGYVRDDYYEEDSSPGILFSVIIGLVLAIFPPLVMKGQLQSVRMQASAGNYEKTGSCNITLRRDIFLYHTVNRVPRPKETQNRSGGGSTTFRGSSGRSHGGRGGGF